MFGEEPVFESGAFRLEGDTLEIIGDQVRSCTRCDLCRTRTLAVPGSGRSNARIMLVGEGPGWNEDQQGLPFVGAAGRYLDTLLEMAELKRSEVFITNVVKCRPPSNRDPLPDEIAACNDYLDRQLAIIDPVLVVTLGRFSMGKWFPGDKISRIHGQEKRFGLLTVMPMYHPAAALRTGAVKALLEADFTRVPIVAAAAERSRNSVIDLSEPWVETADQLPLF